MLCANKNYLRMKPILLAGLYQQICELVNPRVVPIKNRLPSWWIKVFVTNQCLTKKNAYGTLPTRVIKQGGQILRKDFISAKFRGKCVLKRILKPITKMKSRFVSSTGKDNKEVRDDVSQTSVLTTTSYKIDLPAPTTAITYKQASIAVGD